MFKRFYPYEYADSVFVIDYKKLYGNGFRAVIFDIDNTLVHHGDPSTEEVRRLFDDIRAAGMKILLLSNNSEERIKSFLGDARIPYLCEADKPNKDGYLRALDLLGVSAGQAVCVGDQVFTDILGANRSGIASILVRFIQLDPEAPIGRKRQLEKLILKFYSRNKAMQGRLGGVILQGEQARNVT